jgi:hypothetical protein
MLIGLLPPFRSSLPLFYWSVFRTLQSESIHRLQIGLFDLVCHGFLSARNYGLQIRGTRVLRIFNINVAAFTMVESKLNLDHYCFQSRLLDCLYLSFQAIAWLQLKTRPETVISQHSIQLAPFKPCNGFVRRFRAREGFKASGGGCAERASKKASQLSLGLIR